MEQEGNDPEKQQIVMIPYPHKVEEEIQYIFHDTTELLEKHLMPKACWDMYLMPELYLNLKDDYYIDTSMTFHDR